MVLWKVNCGMYLRPTGLHTCERFLWFLFLRWSWHSVCQTWKWNTEIKTESSHCTIFKSNVFVYRASTTKDYHHLNVLPRRSVLFFHTVLLWWINYLCNHYAGNHSVLKNDNASHWSHVFVQLHFKTFADSETLLLLEIYIVIDLKWMNTFSIDNAV